MSFSLQQLKIFGALCFTIALVKFSPAAVLTNVASESLLQFVDGSSLHGQLERIEAGNKLVWRHPAGKEPLQFKPENVSMIRFEKATYAAPGFKPTCRFRFRNGDEIIGNLVGVQNDTAKLESWFGGTLDAPKISLESITFSTRGYKLLYEGPNGADGWRTGRNPRAWEYKDGAFISNSNDVLGRDFNLTTSSSIEFDLNWSGQFSLQITLYAQAIDRYDYSSSAYILYLGASAATVQRIEAGSGATLLGQVLIPQLARKNRAHFEIRSNKEDATISLLADGSFIQRWKDNNPKGFIAKGSGLVFFSQGEPRSLKISNIRVAEWDGKFEPEALTNAPPDRDFLLLANRDKVVGDLQNIEQGKITVLTKQGKLDIPMERVTQISLKRAELPPSENAPWQVRASFPGGETIAFKLENWDTREVSGKSAIFGHVAFKPENIRQLFFNTERGPNSKSADEAEFDFSEFE